MFVCYVEGKRASSHLLRNRIGYSICADPAWLDKDILAPSKRKAAGQLTREEETKEGDDDEEDDLFNQAAACGQPSVSPTQSTQVRGAAVLESSTPAPCVDRVVLDGRFSGPSGVLLFVLPVRGAVDPRE